MSRWLTDSRGKKTHRTTQEAGKRASREEDKHKGRVRDRLQHRPLQGTVQAQREGPTKDPVGSQGHRLQGIMDCQCVMLTTRWQAVQGRHKAVMPVWIP